MAETILVSVIKDEVEFTKTLVSNPKYLSKLASIYHYMNSTWGLDRPSLFKVYCDFENRENPFKGILHHLNIVSNRQIFEIVKTLNSEYSDLDTGYSKFNIFTEKIGCYNKPTKNKYTVENILYAFIKVENTFNTVQNKIVTDILNVSMENKEIIKNLLAMDKDSLYKHKDTIDKLETSCIEALSMLFEFVLDDAEFETYQTFETRYNYIKTETPERAIESQALGDGLHIASDNYSDIEAIKIKFNSIKELPVGIDEEDPFKEEMDSIDDTEKNSKYNDNTEDEKENAKDLNEEQKKVKESTKEVEENEKISEVKEEIKKLIGANIKQTVKDLVNTMSELYESNFSSIPHFGILCNNDKGSPLIKFKYENGSPRMVHYQDEGTLFDSIVMDVLKNVAPEVSRYAPLNSDKDSVPPISYMMTNSSTCHKLHLQFQQANIAFSAGRVSIRKWITETQLENSNCKNSDQWIKEVNQGKSCLRSFKMVKDWYKWCIENIIVDALYDHGIRPENIYTEEVRNTIPIVLAAVSKNLKNIAVISERTPGVKEEFRISTDYTLDFENKIQGMLKNKLNIGNSNSILIKKIDYKYGVLSFTIVYDIEEESKAQLFAGDIVDTLISSGNTPSWSHALLGKKENGTYFFWDDFMDPSKATPEKRCYTIYAGSRSGKGVMTSTLVAAALCDRKNVFYTDGKPENGACLGEIAWSTGKEAYVWNGTSTGSKPYAGSMEQYTYGVRSNEEIAKYLHKLPKCLFENSKYFSNEKQEKFLGTMRYLKSMMLCSEIITARANGVLDKNNWQIWIFDEMTKMSSQEKDIRQIFNKYLVDKGVKVNSVKDKTLGDIFVSFGKDKKLDEMITPGSETYDAGVEYIYKWQAWSSNIYSKMSDASVIHLGKADLNLIFIFQEPSWIATDSSITTIGMIVKKLKSTKIAGNKAIPRQAGEAAGEYGDATMKQPWIDKINSGTGWWVMSHASDIKSSSVTLFKPYTVWTTPLGPGDTKSTEPLPEKQKTRYLAGYIEKLLSVDNTDASELLQDSYNYANNAVKSMDFASDIKEFIYDCTNFAIKGLDSSYDNVIDKLQNGNSPQQNDNSPLTSIGDIELEDKPLQNTENALNENALNENGLFDKDNFSDDKVLFSDSTEESVNNEDGNEIKSESDLDSSMESLKKLLNDINNKMDEAPEEETEQDKWKRLHEVQQQQMEVVKTMSEIARVFMTNYQSTPNYNLNNNGVPVYKDYTCIKQYGEEVSFKNSLKSTFSIGKKSLSRKLLAWRGIDKEASGLFIELLNSLEYEGVDFKSVTKVKVEVNQLQLNKRVIDIKQTFLDESLMDLVDIVDFNVMFRRMKNIAKLDLDHEAMDKLYQQECAGTTADYMGAIVKLFANLPKLIELDYVDYQGKDHMIRRDMLNDPSVKDKIKDMEDSGILCSKLKLASFNRFGGVQNNSKLTAKARGAVKTLTASGNESSVPKTLVGVGIASSGLAVAGAVFGAPIVLFGLAGMAIHNIAKLGAAGEGK